MKITILYFNTIYEHIMIAIQIVAKSLLDLFWVYRLFIYLFISAGAIE